MLNIKKMMCLMLSGLISVATIASLSINSNANTVLPYKYVDGVKSINIVELSKLSGGQVFQANHEVYGKGYNITIGGKLINIYEDAPFIFIDGRMTALKTEIISADGLEYNFPVMNEPVKDGDGFLIPMYVIENKLNIKGNNSGIVIKKEEDKEEIEEDKEEVEDDSDNKEEVEEDNNSNNGSSNNNNINSNSNNNNNSTDNESNNSSSNNSSNNGSNQGSTDNNETSKPTGLSFSELQKKMASLGFDNNGYYMENNSLMGVATCTDNFFAIALHENSPTFNNVVKNCFNMLLPTSGNKLFDIVSSPFKDQTLELDGRLVTIKQYPQGVTVNITNK